MDAKALLLTIASACSFSCKELNLSVGRYDGEGGDWPGALLCRC